MWVRVKWGERAQFFLKSGCRKECKRLEQQLSFRYLQKSGASDKRKKAALPKKKKVNREGRDLNVNP